VLRGLLYGSPGFATFCLLVGVLLGSTGIAMAFVLSLGAALAVQGTTWLILMTGPRVALPRGETGPQRLASGRRER